MSLSSIQLDAFLAVCRTQNFTQAADSLHVTQSALSQRIKNLEDELGTTLFTRDPQGARITETGTRLLRYCQAKQGLEQEFLETLKSAKPGELRGTLRIAAFSSITKSVVLPALKTLLLKHENIQLDLKTAELNELPGLLSSGRADFVFVNEPIRKQGVLNELVFHERNVVIQAKAAPSNLFFDHDENDSATLDFFKHQERELPKGFRRSFVGSIDAILASVQMGLGRAVAPKHLLENLKGVEVAKSYGEQKIPVYLASFEQPFYTDLHKAAHAALRSLSV